MRLRFGPGIPGTPRRHVSGGGGGPTIVSGTMQAAAAIAAFNAAMTQYDPAVVAAAAQAGAFAGVATQYDPAVLAASAQAAAFAGTGTVAPMFSGCVAWFDLADTASFSQSAGTLTSITNKASGVAWNTGTLPAYSATALGGTLPGLDFNGTTQAIRSTEAAVVAALKDSPAHTMFIVCQPDNADRLDTFFGAGAAATESNRSKIWGKHTNGAGKYLIQATNDAASTVSGQSVGVPTIVPQILEFRTSTTQAWIQVNGATADPSAFAFACGTTTIDRCAIGVRPDLTPDIFLDGKISEIQLFNSELSSGDRSTMRVYLGAKWGIAVTP